MHRRWLLISALGAGLAAGGLALSAAALLRILLGGLSLSLAAVLGPPLALASRLAGPVASAAALVASPLVSSAGPLLLASVAVPAGLLLASLGALGAWRGSPAVRAICGLFWRPLRRAHRAAASAFWPLTLAVRVAWVGALCAVVAVCGGAAWLRPLGVAAGACLAAWGAATVYDITVTAHDVTATSPRRAKSRAGRVLVAAIGSVAFATGSLMLWAALELAAVN